MTYEFPSIRFVRDLDGIVDTRHALARAAASGRAQRVSRGAYVDRAAWAALERRQQYEIRVRAVAATRRGRAVLSHESAAVIHGLPLLGVPTVVHITTDAVNQRRSYSGVVKHLGRLNEDDVIERDGLLLTSIERTVLDIAATASLGGAVMAVDRALLVDRWSRVAPLTAKDRLVNAWERAQPMRAHARTLAAIRLGESRSESALESMSRVSMFVLGCPRPRLQALHSDREGAIGYSDFDWPDFEAVAEADGDVKYLDPVIRGSRSAERVVLDEKRREDRIRDLPKRFTRWRWDVGANPERLREKLLRLGLPLGGRWSLE